MGGRSSIGHPPHWKRKAFTTLVDLVRVYDDFHEYIIRAKIEAFLGGR
jgi:hypothetical protein